MSVLLGVIAPPPTWQRPVGDAGNAQSYRQRVIFHHIEGISSSAILRPVPNPALLEPYLAAAQSLVRRGAQVIGTTCGFLSPLQAQIAGRIGVPFVSSALLQIGLAHRLTGRRVGIVTADVGALTAAYLEAAGAASDVPTAILGLQSCSAFTNSAVRGSHEMRQQDVQAAILDAIGDLLLRYGDIGSFVLECHNLPPFSAAIRAAFGRPVFDVLTLMEWVASSLDMSSRSAYPPP